MGPEPKSSRQNHPGESATRRMTTHPDHSQDVPTAPTVDDLIDSDSLRASRDPELTAWFVNDALPYLNSALGMISPVDYEDRFIQTAQAT